MKLKQRCCKIGIRHHQARAQEVVHVCGPTPSWALQIATRLHKQWAKHGAWATCFTVAFIPMTMLECKLCVCTCTTWQPQRNMDLRALLVERYHKPIVTNVHNQGQACCLCEEWWMSVSHAPATYVRTCCQPSMCIFRHL